MNTSCRGNLPALIFMFALLMLWQEFSSEYRSVPLVECAPFVVVGEICIYTHKSSDFYYVSLHKTGSPEEFGSGNTERQRFRNSYFFLWQSYLVRRVVFESRLAEILFRKYFDT